MGNKLINATKVIALAVGLLLSGASFADKAYLEITLKIKESNRASAGAVYTRYKQPFLKDIDGAMSKELLLRDDDVQVLHGFESVKQAKAYLNSELFTKDVVGELGPLLEADPEIRIYNAM